MAAREDSSLWQRPSDPAWCWGCSMWGQALYGVVVQWKCLQLWQQFPCSTRLWLQSKELQRKPGECCTSKLSVMGFWICFRDWVVQLTLNFEITSVTWITITIGCMARSVVMRCPSFIDQNCKFHDLWGSGLCNKAYGYIGHILKMYYFFKV